MSLEGYITANVMIEGLKRTGPMLDTERLVEGLESLRDLDLGLGTLVNFGRTEHQGIHRVWGTQLDAQAPLPADRAAVDKQTLPRLSTCARRAPCWRDVAQQLCVGICWVE